MKVFSGERIALFLGGAAAAALTAGALIASNAEAATVGEQAPEFIETDSKGDTVRLADFKGKTVVLEWTNDGCPFVGKHYDSGNMQRTQAEAEKEGVVWLSVISSRKGAQGYADGPRADRLTVARGAHPTKVLLDTDGSMGRAYGARTTPHMFVIDPAGKLAYNGAIDLLASADPDDIPKAKNFVLAAIDAIKAGRTPQPATTAPYGCGVKY